MDEIQKYSKDAFEAVQSGNWKFAAAFALLLVCVAIRKYGTKLPLIGKHLADGKVMWAVVVVTGALGALGNGLAAGVPLGGAAGVGKLLASGAFVGLASTGAFKGLKEWLDKNPKPPVAVSGVISTPANDNADPKALPAAAKDLPAAAKDLPLKPPSP